MVTDDPGTPGDRHWEINIAGLLAATNEQKLIQVPYADINYGIGERIQLKLETGWATLREKNSRSNSGAGTLLAGVKFRFMDEAKDGVSISTYPQVQFHPFFSSSDPAIADAGNQYILPFELSKAFGQWEINPEVGYLYGTNVSSAAFYGFVIAFENAKPLEPLAEIHINTRLDGTGSTTLLNLGLRYALSPQVNLMAACGHTVTQIQGTDSELDIYLGLQLEI